MLAVKMDIEGASKMLQEVGEKQLPFAFAYTLTLTANDARQEVVRSLPQKFALRTGWWRPFTRFGFNVRPAAKKRLIAEIYTRAYFMRYHEEGGTKRPHSGKTLAIPTKHVRKHPAQRISQAKRPPAMLRRPRRPGFFLNTRSGPVLFRRVTKHQLKAQYVLTRQVRIQPRLGMRDTADKILRTRLGPNFEKAFAEALRTAK